VRCSERAYTFHRRRRAVINSDGYLVFQADGSFPLVEDGQDRETIDAVDSDCRYLGFVSVQASPSA
jgi:hypothetical protein